MEDHQDKEVEIGQSLKLLVQVAGKEGEKSVLGGLDLVMLEIIY